MLSNDSHLLLPKEGELRRRTSIVARDGPSGSRPLTITSVSCSSLLAISAPSSYTHTDALFLLLLMCASVYAWWD